MKEKGRGMLVFGRLLVVIGILCLLYYTIQILYAGISTSFAWFWLVGGIFCVVLGSTLFVLFQRGIELPSWMQKGALTIVILGLILFLIVEGKIVYHANLKPREEADYMVVLGARIKGDVITRSLRKRLEVATEYLQKNVDTIVIVSGGKGEGESMSEAEAMKKYLVERGIDATRIVQEAESFNTEQNIQFSKKLVQGDNRSIVVVSNGFHLYRATSIAKKQKIGRVEGLSAPSDPIMFLSYYVREALAVGKDIFKGNMNF